MDKQILLRLKDLQAFYGNAHILKGVSLYIYKGEIVSLLGANGAGKTTTLISISGLIKSIKGKIEFSGEEINRLSGKERVKKGLIRVPEGRNLFSQMTVLENLELGGYLLDKKEITKGLDYVFHYFPRLKERIEQEAGSLSGGEQQMLAIGRGLMSKPSLFLLDEPSLGLAPLMIQQIVNILIEINKDGTTIFLVEQNARMALKISTRGYVLETGKITLEGESKDLIVNDHIVKAYLGV